MGRGRLSEIGRRCVAMEVSNPLIVTDKGSRDLPFISQLQEYLTQPGLSSGIFSDISPNPRDDEIGAGREAFRLGNHDAIIAIGGGSAMDGGKAVCLTARNDIDLWAFEWEKLPTDIDTYQPFPTLITIPTTAGTGAETESTAMITHTGKGMKFCICHAALKPSLALLDPDLTVGLPANLTAWTGVDAMVPCNRGLLRARVPSRSVTGWRWKVWRWWRNGCPLRVRDPANLGGAGVACWWGPVWQGSLSKRVWVTCMQSAT